LIVMPSQYRHRRTSSPSTPFPATLEPGEIAVNTANRQLALGDAAGGSIGTPLPLLTIRFFDVRAQYVINDYVMQNGIVYRAKGSIPPGAFNASNWDVISNPGTFILKAGDTMTGHLSLPTGPAAANAVRKDYVDAADTALTTDKVAKAGDTMTGLLTLSGAPTVNLHAATKKYVDDKPALIISDAPPATPLDNLLWWDSDTGTLYVRYNDGVGAPQWVQAVAMPAIDTAAFVQRSGDTMTGDLTLKGNPTAPLHAVPKQYLESAVPRYQRISLGGLSQVDVQVPTGAKLARLTAMLWNTAALTGTILTLSMTPGVFRNTAGDYGLYGFGQNTGAALPGITTGVAVALPYMQLHTGATNAGQAVQLEAHLTLARPDTGRLFNCESRAAYFDGANSNHVYYTNYMQQVASGSALSVLAFRFLGSTVWGAESYLNVEWM
jgi:hypothetical protein